MSLDEALAQLLRAYKAYYNINTESPAEPFQAEAGFRLHDEQYFLFKSAKLSEADSNEYVFFATRPELTLEELSALDRRAWEEGLSRVEPKANHRNTDVTLVVLTEQLHPDAAAFAKKAKHYQSYCFGFRGWSNYRLIVYDLNSGEIAHNRQGENLKKIISNIKTTSF